MPKATKLPKYVQINQASSLARKCERELRLTQSAQRSRLNILLFRHNNWALKMLYESDIWRDYCPNYKAELLTNILPRLNEFLSRSGKLEYFSDAIYLWISSDYMMNELLSKWIYDAIAATDFFSWNEIIKLGLDEREYAHFFYTQQLAPAVKLIRAYPNLMQLINRIWFWNKQIKYMNIIYLTWCIDHFSKEKSLAVLEEIFRAWQMIESDDKRKDFYWRRLSMIDKDNAHDLWFWTENGLLQANLDRPTIN